MVTTRGLEAEQWDAYREVYAFVGNELLTPMNRSGNVQGLSPAFWRAVPAPCNERGRRGLVRLVAYAEAAAAQGDCGDGDAGVPGMLQTSVEYTHLFIGPPRPVAEPWETTSDPAGEKRVGFGRATAAMRELLAQEGLELCNGNRQYEDHLGIELLYLSVLCEKAAGGAEAPDAVGGTQGGDAPYRRKTAWFIAAHPLRWIGTLRTSVDGERPDGYYSALLEYVQGVLEDHAASLDGCTAASEGR